MAKRIDPKTIALQFNDCINSRNLGGLMSLMADDHSFIDTGNNLIKGKPNCEIAWSKFFESFPDYQNIIEIVTSKDATAFLQGHSVCTDKRLEGKAIWTARIADYKVLEWRVFPDSTENRIMLGIT